MPRIIRRWLATYLALIGLVFFGVAAFNLRYDPFHMFRDSGSFVIDQRHQRFMHAGMLRSGQPIKTLLVGTSYVANFDPELMAERFGGPAHVASTWGASQRENIAVARLALANHPEIETVLFEQSIWNACSAALHPSWTFPMGLYREQPAALAGYLLSWETTTLSMQKRRGDGELFSDDRAKVVRWWDDHQNQFGVVSVLENAFAQTIAVPPDPPATLGHAAMVADQTANCFRDMIVPMAEDYPSTEFVVFNPPVMQWLLWAYHGHGMLEPWLIAQEKMAALAANAPNLRYFDFYATVPQLRWCSYWRDMSHFDLRVSDMIVNWLAEGAYERRPGNGAGFDGPIRDVAESRLECSD